MLSRITSFHIGLRAVGRSDNGVSPAEYIYGQTLRLLGDFNNIADNRNVADCAFIDQLSLNISRLKPVSRELRDSWNLLFVHNVLDKCDYVFIGHDAVRRPLTHGTTDRIV